jgi:hypothetical protein
VKTMSVEIGLKVKCQDCKETIEIKPYTISFYNKQRNLVVLCTNCCKINVYQQKIENNLMNWLVVKK